MKAIIVGHNEFKDLSLKEISEADFVAELDFYKDWVYVLKNKVDGYLGTMNISSMENILRNV